MLPLPFKKDRAAELLRDSSTLATVIHLIVLSAYGEELYGDPERGIEPMDPIELYARIQEDFSAQLTEEGENRLNGLMMAVSTDGFYEDPLVFTSVAHALFSGDLGDLVDGAIEDLDVPNMLWAIYEVAANRDDDNEFSPPVAKLQEEVINSDIEGSDDPEGEPPQYEVEVTKMHTRLLEQLHSLGVDSSKLPRP